MSILSFVTDPIKSKLQLIGLIVGGGLLVGLIGMAVYFWHDYQSDKKDLDAAKVQNATLQGTNKNLEQTVEKTEKSAAVNEQTQVQVDEGKKVIDDKVSSIAKAHVQSVQNIEQKYKQLPQTDDNAKAKEAELSADRMKRLWQVFCIPNPGYKDCAANAPDPAASFAASAASQ